MAKKDEPQLDDNGEALFDITDDSDEANRPEWDDEKWLAKEDEAEEVSVDLVEADTEVAESNAADSAVDEIVQKESDEVLAAEDKKIAEAFEGDSGWRAGLAAFWANPKQRYGLISGILVALLILFVIPITRFSILNGVGVRATASIVVLDQETQTPLKNVDVAIGSEQSQTDIRGRATLSDVRLGAQTLTITKSAYDSYTQEVTIGAGSNAIEQVALLPIGTQFALSLIHI